MLEKSKVDTEQVYSSNFIFSTTLEWLQANGSRGQWKEVKFFLKSANGLQKGLDYAVEET